MGDLEVFEGAELRSPGQWLEVSIPGGQHLHGKGSQVRRDKRSHTHTHAPTENMVLRRLGSFVGDCV